MPTKEEAEKLTSLLERSITTKPKHNSSASIAYSKSGKNYHGILVESQSHLLNILPEYVALAQAALHKDYGVNHVLTLTQENKDEFSPSPLAIKFLMDHQSRTGGRIKYTVINSENEVMFSSDNLSSMMPWYKSPDYLLNVEPEAKPIKISGKSSEKEIIENPLLLKEFAKRGTERSFLTSEKGTRYGAAVLLEDGTIYYAGQYSSFDHRLNIHAEMNALITPLVNGEKDIKALGIVSTKFKDSPCNICGHCRQFTYEISSRLNIEPIIYTFSLESDNYVKSSINDYLPSAWTLQK